MAYFFRLIFLLFAFSVTFPVSAGTISVLVFETGFEENSNSKAVEIINERWPGSIIVDLKIVQSAVISDKPHTRTKAKFCPKHFPTYLPEVDKCSDEPPTCASDEVLKDGVCRKKNPCPEGQHEEGGACVPDQCGKDEIRVNGQCVPEKCPDGQDKVNGQCPNKCERLKGQSSWYEGPGGNSSAMCDGGCLLSLGGSEVC